MVWFYIDDGFYSHTKVVSIPRSIRPEAIGCWTLAGTWAAGKLTDGKVPTHMLEELGCSEAAIEALVTAKLWRRNRHGIVFHNWTEWQKSRAEILGKRETERIRKATERAAKAGKPGPRPNGHGTESVTPIPSPTHLDRQDLTHRLNSVGGSAEDDQLSPELSPVVESVVRGVAKHCHRQLHPLVVPDVLAFLDERRGHNAEPLKVPARYYATAIAKSAFEVQQFIDQKGLAA